MPLPPKPKEILGVLHIPCITDYFTVEPIGVLPISGPLIGLRNMGL